MNTTIAVKREICPHGKSDPKRLTLLIPKNWMEQVKSLQEGIYLTEQKGEHKSSRDESEALEHRDQERQEGTAVAAAQEHHASHPHDVAQHAQHGIATIITQPITTASRVHVGKQAGTTLQVDIGPAGLVSPSLPPVLPLFVSSPRAGEQ